MAVAWPGVKNWIYTTATGLPSFSSAGAEVFHGVPVTMSAPTSYLAVGAVMDENNAGTYSRELVYDGTVWQETGEVRSMLVAASGDSDDTEADVDAFTLAAALDTAVQADPRLGGALSPDSEVRTSVDVLSISNQSGTADALVWVLTYTTIY